MSEEWGPWIEHDGSGCPGNLAGKYIQIESAYEYGGTKLNEGRVPLILSERQSLCWCGGGEWMGCYAMPIIRYRVRKPRALQQLRELVESLPEGVDA